jgi:ABC-2 type transport system permease protein
MGAVMTIMRRDMKAAFMSPRAAAIFFFFLIFMGSFFFNFVETFVSLQAQSPMMGGEAPTLEQVLKGIFYNLHFILILIVPAVTMSSFAEEKKNLSFRLLQTAPISATQVVFGKFLGVAGLMTTILLASAVFPAFLVAFGTPDLGVIASSYIGMFLLICSQLAFGMWVSSLTNNQFLAFIFTMAGLFMLLIIDFLAPSMTGNSLIESVLKYFSTTKHLDIFVSGTVAVSDVTYFLVLTAGFLFFTNVTLDSQRWR